MTDARPAPAKTVLLADVGGTNCRFLLQDGRSGDAVYAAVYAPDDYPAPADAITAFLREAGGAGDAAPACAALAVAGPVRDGRAQLTNTAWCFDVRALEKTLGFARVLLVNDLAAQARAAATLRSGELAAIGASFSDAASEADPFAGVRCAAVVAPGTGLGVARLDFVGAARRPHAVATEGGHVGFAPSDDVEMELLRLWRPHLGRVTNEHVISGPGLVRIYRALGAMRDVRVEPIEGPEIMSRALSGADSHCIETIERFAKIFGGVCGDVALAQGAEAVVIAGSIANSLEPVLRRGGFRARFDQRGPGKGFLAEAACVLAKPADLGLRGARALLDDDLEERPL